MDAAECEDHGFNLQNQKKNAHVQQTELKKSTSYRDKKIIITLYPHNHYLQETVNKQTKHQIRLDCKVDP